MTQTIRHQLRKDALNARQQLAAADRAEFESRINALLSEHASFQTQGMIAGYTPIKGEVDITPFLRARAICALPRVIDDHTMVFHSVDDQTQLIANKWGIPEPDPALHPVFNDIEVILLPLVAFDRMGHRLGMGAGYYDRYLATFEPRPFCCGVAFACQEVTEIPDEEWDQALDAVVTEAGIIEF